MGMVLPASYAEIEQEEMMYLDGGGIVYYYSNVYLTTNATKALTSMSVGAAVSLVLAATPIPVLGQIGAGAIASMVTSYVNDKNVKGPLYLGRFYGKVGFEFNRSGSQYGGSMYIGW